MNPCSHAVLQSCSLFLHRSISLLPTPYSSLISHLYQQAIPDGIIPACPWSQVPFPRHLYSAP
jgi:hypothetical protein